MTETRPESTVPADEAALADTSDTAQPRPYDDDTDVDQENGL